MRQDARLIKRREMFMTEPVKECESEFNAVERANKDVFIAREKAMGWR